MKKDSLAGKIIAFALAIITAGVCILAVMQATYMLDRAMYSSKIHEEVKKDVATVYGNEIISNVLWSGIKNYDVSDSGILGAKLVSNKQGIPQDYVILWECGEVVDFKEPFEKYKVDNLSYYNDGSNVEYSVWLYLAKNPKMTSDFYMANKIASWMEKTRIAIYPIGIVSLILCIASLIYLFVSAGHKRDSEEISGTFITKIPIDLYTILNCIVGFITIYLGVILFTTLKSVGSIISITGTIGLFVYIICAFISLLWLMDFVVRIKMGKWWRNTIVYRIVRIPFVAAKRLMKNIPLVQKTVIIYGGIVFLELMGILMFNWSLSGGFIFLWIIEKILILVFIMAVALIMRNLKIAAEKISNGELEYQVDTSKMFWDFKVHGENLNTIGQGLNLAVDDKLKSERMKTELITNVSHDIKTPLTSIINYSDLLGRELDKIEEQLPESEENINKLKEYYEVLNRQSVRLKRLIEDLVEASKASTGNLEVNLEPMEIGVMLAQTEGEYEDKLQESDLTLIVEKPDKPIYVMADGRRLWRVLDNVLNNVCKYALQDTRVYLSLKENLEEGKVIISLKNISREQLNISPDELLERFVQGDKSRMTEGSGLGLSIAKSLTELQNGSLELKIDGDLFKVVITLPMVVDATLEMPM